MFLEGKTPSFIANYLTAQGIPTPAKKDRMAAEYGFKHT